MSQLYKFTATATDGTEVNLADYQGRVLLIVNTASKCGFTPQYSGLEKLQGQFHGQGFDVLAFPCNQFGKQEPGTDEEIVEFCTMNFNTSFPLFSKIDVNGDHAHPLFSWLKKEAPGIFGSEGIKWNFTKFLINRNGEVVKRYASKDKPEAIAKDIAALI